MLKLPRFRAAAVQASPVYLNPGATADKAASLIREAAANGAKLVAFPEVFVPGYPYWNWITDPVTGSAWFEKLAKASVLVPGPEVDAVRKAARDTGCYVVLGVNERSPVSLGAIYNTLVFIGPDGAVLGKHRKLVPTWAEKLTWTGGDGSSLRVYDTEIGRLGGLACGENTNTLARFALLGQGELVHVASYISLPVAPPTTTWRRRSSCARSPIPLRARFLRSSPARPCRRRSSRRWKRSSPTRVRACSANQARSPASSDLTAAWSAIP
ncbi:hypothetical protein BJ6T_62410 [Bradyrhizobium japonicum USDA 6]|nr:hypothetical protein BJ6T_62410 [Bradyrhizobium japonicum USDA 6]